MKSQVIVEFYAVPRLQAGQRELSVTATTAAEALAAVAQACPALSALLTAEGKLAPQYLLSLEGERFIDDLHEPLPEGAHLILLSADAGG